MSLMSDSRPVENRAPTGPRLSRNVPQQVTLSGYSHFELQIDQSWFRAQVPAVGGPR